MANTINVGQIKEVEFQENRNTNLSEQSIPKFKLEVGHSGCRCRLGSVSGILNIFGCTNVTTYNTPQSEGVEQKFYWEFNYNGDKKQIEDNLIQGGFNLVWC